MAQKYCVGVFCGASSGSHSIYAESVRHFTQALKTAQMDVVYGGAKVGLMGVLADSMLASGGAVTGVMTEHLMDKELVHEGLSTLHIVKSMHERKALICKTLGMRVHASLKR